MINKALKITMLSLMVSMGLSTSSMAVAQDTAEEKVMVDSIPFVVALRKIVPVEYDYAFETDMDLGELVSYEYKTNWEESLSLMLANLNLSYEVKDNIIIMKDADVSTAANYSDNVVVEESVESEVLAETEAKVFIGSETSVDIIAETDGTVFDDGNIDQDEVEESVYLWKVRKGFTLQETMKKWGEQVGWNVIWNTDRDFDIQSEVSFSGSFVDATSGLISAFAKADPPVVGTFYKNNTLVIETTSNGEVN